MTGNKEKETSLEFWTYKYPYLFKVLLNLDIEFWKMAEESLVEKVQENQSLIENEVSTHEIDLPVHLEDLDDLLAQPHIEGFINKATVNVHCSFVDLFSVLNRFVKRVVHSYGVKDELPNRIDYLLTSIKHKLLSIFVIFENICVPQVEKNLGNNDSKNWRELSQIVGHIEQENNGVIVQLDSLRRLTENFTATTYSCATWMLMLKQAEMCCLSAYVYIYAFRQKFVCSLKEAQCRMA